MTGVTGVTGGTVTPGRTVVVVVVMTAPVSTFVVQTAPPQGYGHMHTNELPLG